MEEEEDSTATGDAKSDVRDALMTWAAEYAGSGLRQALQSSSRVGTAELLSRNPSSL